MAPRRTRFASLRARAATGETPLPRETAAIRSPESQAGTPSADGGARTGEGLELSVVVPVFNEEQVLARTYERLTAVLAAQRIDYEILFVDDASTDQGPRQLARLRAVDPHVGVLTFSRNFGHQAAVSAGLEHARGEAAVVVDADLQDPPEVIPALLERWREGYDVVHARRSRRDDEGLFKRLSAALFYRLMRRLADSPMPLDVGDFRLIDRRVRDVLVRLPERRRYVRGLVAWAGFRQTSVDYVRAGRAAGTSKYGVGRMLSLALDGITAFSDRPLYLAGYVGAALLGAAPIALALLAVLALVGRGPSPWLWGAAALALAAGAQLAALGVLGAYVARLHEEALGRPLYVVAADQPAQVGADAPP